MKLRCGKSQDICDKGQRCNLKYGVTLVLALDRINVGG